MFRSISFCLIACIAFLVFSPGNVTNAKSAVDDPKYTVEQVVESVILVYGSRAALDHIRKNGVERGKITRFNAQGTAEETNYERRFIRGENLDKDQIRLDQKLPTMMVS